MTASVWLKESQKSEQQSSCPQNRQNLRVTVQLHFFTFVSVVCLSRIHIPTVFEFMVAFQKFVVDINLINSV